MENSMDMEENSKEPFKATLEVVENGLVLTMPDGCKKVFSEKDDMAELDLTHVPDALYEMLECLGFRGTKWSKYRIEIKLKHGCDYECNDKKCRICKGKQ